MDNTILKHLPSQDQLDHFNTQGYLVIPNALDDPQCDHLESLVDTIWSEQQAQGKDGNLFYPNFVGRDQSFIDLLDHPATFPAAWSILGWNIYLYHSHLGVTPQEADPTEPMKTPLGFHQDSGRVNRDLEMSPRPRVSLKVGYFLSDVSEEGRGNFYVVPGSHLEDNLQKYEDRNPDGAIPVCVNRGDAVFFDRRLWHARSSSTATAIAGSAPRTTPPSAPTSSRPATLSAASSSATAPTATATSVPRTRTSHSRSGSKNTQKLFQRNNHLRYSTLGIRYSAVASRSHDKGPDHTSDQGLTPSKSF